MDRFILAHDVGTSGTKASLYDDHGRFRASVTVAYGISYPAPSSVEQNPEDWWKAVCSASRQVVEQAGIAPGQVAAIGFSGQMMGAVPVDEEANPVRPAIIWADTRAVPQSDLMASRAGFRHIYEVCGHRPSASYSAAKIAWLREYEPTNYARTRVFLQAKDFIIARSTGRYVTDPSDASSTNLFDLHSWSWSPELVDAAGLEIDRLPEVVPSTTVVGELRPDAAALMGLEPGTSVVAGGGDGSCAAVGAGAIRPSVAYACLGSSSWIGICTLDRPLIDPEMRTFTFAHLIDGAYTPTGTMQAGGLSYQWVRSIVEDCQVVPSEGAPLTDLEVAAADVPAGSDGLLFLPYLLGERSPIWNPKARGAFVGLTFTHGRAHLVRSVLEGVALNLRTILDCFRSLDKEPEYMWLIGGAARSRLFCRILASAFGVPVRVPKNVDAATGLGAAVAAGIGVGHYPDWSIVEEVTEEQEAFEPISRDATLYREMHALFQQAYRGLEGINDGLARQVQEVSR